MVKKNYDFIVIGAGISGLVAAQNLGMLGYRVLVLEARNRIGGRIHTIQTKTGKPIELGAGTLRNPGAFSGFSFKSKNIDPERTTLFDEKRHPIHLANFLKEHGLEPRFLEANRKIQAEKRRHQINQTKSQQTSFPTLEHVMETEGKLTKEVLNAMIMQNTGASAEQVSLLEVMKNQIQKTNGYIILNGLEKGLLGPIQRVLENMNVDIEFNSPVHEVHYEDRNNHVKVVLHNGEEYFAESVICSVPLGVLKEGNIHFYPKLSLAKQRAIEHLKTGYTNKVMLEFESPFWPEKSQFIYPDATRLSESPVYFNLFSLLEEHPAILIAEYYGSSANFKNTSDGELIERALAPLKAVFKDKMSTLKSAHVTHWDHDVYSLGSTTYCGVSTTVSDLENIAMAEDAVFFAGEHTAVNLRNTIEGAYRSGIRAALEAHSYLVRKEPEMERSSLRPKK